MPFAINDNIKIYYEIEGRGQPIVLVHGATGNTTFWRGYGYIEQLKEMFTVILVDARGHGKSDKPHKAAAYEYDLFMFIFETSRLRVRPLTPTDLPAFQAMQGNANVMRQPVFL